MKRVIHKLFFAWDFDKEEKWLNEMSAKGLQLTDIGLCRYAFEEGAPGEYVYRMELLNNWPTHPESVQYIRFLEETGAEQVGSLMRWVCFRNKAGQGDFDLFSDIDSRIKHLNRIILLLGVVGIANVPSGIFQIMSYASHGFPINLWAGVFVLFLSAFILYGCARLLLKKHRLQKEKILHE